MKKFCYLVLSAILAFFITTALDLNETGSTNRAEEASLRKPFGSVEGTVGKEVNAVKAVEAKIEIPPPAASRGSSSPTPDNGFNIKLKVFIAEKKQVKEMYLEEYISGVVSGEMPVEFDMEALKAQAVAARTYTVARMKVFAGNGCSKHPGADICTDSSHCQAWSSRIDDKIARAVSDTRGLILAYNSQPVMYPLFFSTSSGKTENSQDIFTGEYPYLRSVLSPYEDVAPKFLSKTVVPINQFIKKFNGYGAKLDKAKLNSQVKVTSRTEGGSVKVIQIGNKSFSGTEIRRILDLNSANFNIDFNNESAVITVNGFGHGVGMSQWGANEMSKRGNRYDEILRHYYLGTDIVRIRDVFKQ